LIFEETIKMKNIALIAGGDSGEHDISIKSAAVVAQNIPSNKYHVYLIEIKGGSWVYRHDVLGEIDIDKNDFSLSIEGEKILFDAVFNAIHGTPGEDGKILGYFEMLGIPFTSSSAISSGLTFNKSYCNKVVGAAGVKVARSVHLIEGFAYEAATILNTVSLPCFVKPNQGGSSVGMSKIKKADELMPAIEKAFAEDSQVLIEEYVEGRELTMGMFGYQGELISFPITEVISKNEFFDFEAKYGEGLNEEITPADIPDELKLHIENTAGRLYQALNLRGVVRFDFMAAKEGLYFIEVNTVPGMSTMSLVPQQIRKMGLRIGDVFDMMLMSVINNDQVS